MMNRNYVQIDFMGITIDEQNLHFVDAQAAINYALEFDIKNYQLYFYDDKDILIAILECNSQAV